MMHQSIATIDSPEFINLQPLEINPLMSSCEIKVLYLGQNRNHSYITKDVATEMAKTLRGAPIVGYYKEEKEDFADHGEKIIFDDEGVKFECMTKPYGFVAPDAKVWFQKFEDTDEFGNKSYSDDGIIFASKIFDAMNHNKEEFVKDKDYKINLESVPGESAAVKLAAKDRLIFGEEKTHEILSNQWIPLTAKCTIKEKVRLSSLFDKKCGGGVISHINIESEFPTEESAWKMLNYLAKNKVIYFAFNSKINECENHHGFVGSSTCPECGGKIIDTYQRIVGYLVPSRNYSSARKKEFNKRQWYEIGQLSDNL